MNFLEIAKNRYTTKKYSNKKIDENQIQQLKEILRLTPSSINSQPWKFAFVSDQQVKNKLAEVSYFNKEKIENASHLVIFNVIDDLDKFEQQVQKHLPEPVVNYFLHSVKPQPDIFVKNWLTHQVYIALGFFISACASMGIDATAMEGIQQEQYTEILKIDGYKALFAVAIGYRDLQDTNQVSITPKSRLALEDIIISI